MPHLERTMSYSRKFVQREAASFANHEVQYANVNVVHIQNRDEEGQKSWAIRKCLDSHVAEMATSVTWLNSGLLMVHLFLNRSEFRDMCLCATQGFLQGHQRPRFLLPFCSSILAYGTLYHNHKMSSLHQCHDCLLHEGKIQRAKSEQVAPAAFSPLGGFLTTSSINPAGCIIVPAGWLTWPSLVTGVWEDGYYWVPLPPQTDKASVSKNE